MAVAFGVGDPAEEAEVEGTRRLGSTLTPLLGEAIEEREEVFDLEIDHRVLSGGEGCVVLFGEGEDDLGVHGGERKVVVTVIVLYEAEMLLVPLVEALCDVVRAQGVIRQSQRLWTCCSPQE